MANLTIKEMYTLYEEDCKSQSPPLKPVSSTVYRRIVGSEYNLFVTPKKDHLCAKFIHADGCSKRQIANEYNEHVQRKVECQAKAADKVEASKQANVAMATIDVQSVLTLPCSQVPCLYYIRKLNTCNLTIYSLKVPNDAVCYCCSEIDRTRGSTKTGTCLLKWLTSFPLTVDEVIVYSGDT